jgi:general secretion pathway protein G
MRTNRGFTLMEMMLVLAVIAMIVGVTVSFLSTTQSDVKYPEAKMKLNLLGTKLVAFQTISDRLPTQSEGLDALVNKPAGFSKPWQSTLYAEDLIDPWGKPFQYRNPAKRSKSAFDLFSMGPDGTENTQDDVGNWR